MLTLLCVLGIIGCGWFCVERFDEEISETARLLVPCTRILWQRTKVCHYC